MCDSVSSGYCQQKLALLWKKLDPVVIGEKFVLALKANDEAALIRETAAYFRNRPVNLYLDGLWGESGWSKETADRALRGDVTVINIPWQFPDGRIDWHFNPTLTLKPVNNEWLWQLNRMSFWRDMAQCYKQSHEAAYAQKFNEQFRSWVVSCPQSDVNGEYGKNTWRTIECGIRLLGMWGGSFEVFRKAPEFTDESICLMLASMYEQALFLRKNHRKRSNWLLMEMAGVYTVASQFTEFRDAEKLRKYAVKVFGKAFCSQILPDGMHDELSPDYHFVSMNCASLFLKQAKLGDRLHELPADFVRTIERAYEAVIKLATPSMTLPRTNDCYTFHLTRLLEDAIFFFPERTDFRWAWSNRREGAAPEAGPTVSKILPYAGFVAMRSSWEPDALFCCFDVGPIGNGHQHWDKLNINIYKGNDELLFDDGGGQYEQSLFRWYGRSAADHNTALVDNMVQMRYMPRILTRPAKVKFITNECFDYAKAVYDETFAVWKYDGNENDVPLFKPATHSREVRFCKPDFFCIVDKLRSADGKLHDYELRWQLNTLKVNKVKKYPGALRAECGELYDLLIVPLFPELLKTSVVCGHVGRLPAGWFIGRNDMAQHKASTAKMKVVQQKNFRFVTLMIPLERGAAVPEICRHSRNLYSIKLNGSEHLINLAALDK